MYSYLHNKKPAVDFNGVKLSGQLFSTLKWKGVANEHRTHYFFSADVGNKIRSIDNKIFFI